MSKSQVLKKGLSVLTVLALVCITLNVSVAAATYTSTTSYDTENNTVQVTSQVTGVGDTEQVTYLAYNQEKGTTPSSSNIIYIDQKAAGTDTDPLGTCTFTYTANVDVIGSTLVKFGAESTSISAPTDGADKVSTVDAEVGNGTSSVGGTVTVTQRAYSGSENCQFLIQPNSGYRISSIVRSDGVPVSVKDLIDPTHYTTKANGKFKLSVFFDKVDDTTTNYIAYGSRNEAVTETGKSSTTYATAKIDNTKSESEYGIVFYYDEAYNTDDAAVKTFVTQNLGKNFDGTIDTNNAGILKYRALGKSSNGSYAVQLKDPQGKYLKDGITYYTRPYLVVDNGAGGYDVLLGASSTVQ